MGIIIPAATSLESPKEEAEVLWKKTTDQTGFMYSGKNSFKSGEGEFTVVGQGDSFSKAHSYLLLSDVPGASANSGATITAKDSEGKQAFVAVETRTGGEQEVAVGAGTQFKTLLDATGKSEFLPATGSSSAEFPGGTTTSSIVTINHGLGVKPSSVDVITEASEGALVPITPRIITGSRNATSFKVRLFGAVEISKTTVNFIWTAHR